MLGKIIFTIFALGGAAVVAAPKKKVLNDINPPAPAPAPGPAPDGKLGGYDFAEFYIGGGKPDQKLPTIILLHAEDSDAAAALPVLSTLSKPARVLVPRGPIATAKGRAYLPAGVQGAALLKAITEQAWALQAFLVSALAKYSVAERLVVVGLGTAGSMAVALGLEGGAWVRLAYGLGGVFTADQMPLAQDPHAIAVRKLSYGDAIGFDKLAAITAAERGIDYLTIYEADVDLIGGMLDDATARAWLMPLLEKDLGG